MTQKYRPGPLRAQYDKTLGNNRTATELADFKSKESFFKIGYWDPRVNGVRYLKELIYNLAAGLHGGNWARLRRIRNRGTGNPIAIKYGGEMVCLDYVQAVLELEFITGSIDLAGLRVLEIGAGYGRTCHAVLSNHPVASYHIIDLGNTLDLAAGYLESVLDEEQFAKVAFIPIEEVDELLDLAHFDLGININSFGEMTADTVRDYLAFVDERCRHLYVKDPVGKYLDTSLDGHSQGREAVELALSTGLLREVIDIHDSQVIGAKAREFVAAYRPGDDWTCVADGWAVPWSFYWQALYRNERPAPSPGEEGRR